MIDRLQRFRVLLVVVAGWVVLSSCDGNIDYPEPISSEKILKPVLIVAHRGGMAYAPENTVVGFKNGKRLESDVLELDVQVRENEIIVLHDFTLNRTTDCALDSLKTAPTLRESCDAGHHWRAGDNTFSGGVGFPLFRGTGVKVPVLEDVFVGVPDENAIFMIELKHIVKGVGEPSIEQAVDTLMAFVVERSLEDRVWFASSNSYVLSRSEATVPAISSMFIWGERIPRSCEENVMDSISLGFDGVAIQAPLTNSVSQSFRLCVQLAQDAGLTVAFWIVNRPNQVEQLLTYQPDMLITDFPACLAALLKDIRIENPYPEEIGEGNFLPKCG